MPGYFFAAPAGYANASTAYEPAGFAVNGDGTLVTASATNFAKGGPAQLTAATANAWSGFTLHVFNGSSTSNRYLVDVSFDGGVTWPVSNLYFYEGGTGSTIAAPYIPFASPAGADVRVRCESQLSSVTLKAAVVGTVAGATSPPGFTHFDNLLTADTAACRPGQAGGTFDVPLDNGTGTAWTTLAAATSAAYGALLAVVDGNGTTFATAQAITIILATGTSGSEVEFYRFIVDASTATNGPIPRGWSNLIEKALASGLRVSARAVGAVPGSDKVRISLYGLR